MKLTITYPESWADIKYSQYLKYYKHVKPYEGTDEFEKINLETAALHFCKIPAEYLYALPKKTFDKVGECLLKLFSEHKTLPLVKSFAVDNTTYSFIPDLDSITYGEYLDLVSYTNKNIWDNVPIVFSILYRPTVHSLGKQYTIEPYLGTNDDRIELLKHVLTMDVVFGATAFFLNLQRDLQTGILTYTMEMVEQKKTDPRISQVLQDLEKNGVDIAQLQSFLTMTSQNLIQ
jgi:hypothetical protein